MVALISLGTALHVLSLPVSSLSRFCEDAGISLIPFGLPWFLLILCLLCKLAFALICVFTLLAFHTQSLLCQTFTIRKRS